MEVKRLPGQFGEAGLEHIITLLPQFKNSLPDLLEQERLIVVYFLKRSYFLNSIDSMRLNPIFCITLSFKAEYLL